MRHPGSIDGKRISNTIAAFCRFGAFGITRASADKNKKYLPTTKQLQKASGAANISANISDMRALGYTVNAIPCGRRNGSRITRFYVEAKL